MSVFDWCNVVLGIIIFIISIGVLISLAKEKKKLAMDEARTPYLPGISKINLPPKEKLTAEMIRYAGAKKRVNGKPKCRRHLK